MELFLLIVFVFLLALTGVLCGFLAMLREDIRYIGQRLDAMTLILRSSLTNKPDKPKYHNQTIEENTDEKKNGI